MGLANKEVINETYSTVLNKRFKNAWKLQIHQNYLKN